MTDSQHEVERLSAAIATAIAHLESSGATPTHDTYGDRRRLMLSKAKALVVLRDALLNDINRNTTPEGK